MPQKATDIIPGARLGVGFPVIVSFADSIARAATANSIIDITLPSYLEDDRKGVVARLAGVCFNIGANASTGSGAGGTNVWTFRLVKNGVTASPLWTLSAAVDAGRSAAYKTTADLRTNGAGIEFAATDTLRLDLSAIPADGTFSASTGLAGIVLTCFFEVYGIEA